MGSVSGRANDAISNSVVDVNEFNEAIGIVKYRSSQLRIKKCRDILFMVSYYSEDPGFSVWVQKPSGAGEIS
ncbi:Os04g0673250 [Oryza sativa Japonica Group]|uniref:Os04g0673250 protein n=1 Tax=Oryza sativa subsp. japonica TaxID=39947 RepID=A0A0P0WGG7_ORYSJ|nr:Os04g0673250 [Oryza sativa Japonica Group]